MNNGRVAIMIKLNRKTRDSLKSITHQNHTTIQSVLNAFAESYIRNPEQFKMVKSIDAIKIEDDKIEQLHLFPDMVKDELLQFTGE